MKNLFNLILLLTVIVNTSYAQFGPPPGRGMGGDGNGRANKTTSPQQATLNLDSDLPKGNSKVSGFVIDSAVTKAVEYANIAMKNEETGKIVDGTMADEKGKFAFSKVAPGKYTFTVSFIGYADTNKEHVIVKKGEDIDLGVIKMNLNAKMLNEVTVTGVKSLIEEKVDRLVYNAENDLTSKGGDGADVLRKVPMLSVDLDGNVSLRGSENIRVLINNKPSTIVASSVADALRMIPADLIKSVEVITSPSAKYDAEGTSGIINIITKKSSIQGYNLNLNTGVGIRGSNLGLNGSLRVGKFGFTLGGFGRSFYNKANTELYQTTFNVVDRLTGTTNDITTNQTADAKDFGVFGRYNVGIDYEISKSTFLNATVSFGTRNFVRDMDYVINRYADDVLTSTDMRLVNTKDLSNNVDVNLDYVKIFNPGQEWSISSQYSQNNLTNNFATDVYSLEGNVASQQQNINGNVNSEITLQTDYMQPIGSRQMFEVGVKRIQREVNSDYKYLIGLNGSFEADFRNPQGYLDYSQAISAGYLSYTYSTKNKISFKVGARYEHTTIEAVDNAVQLNIPTYFNIVPSVNISKSLTSGGAIKLAYNNRIQRPGLQQLNPNYNAANPQSIRIGNPNLKPEISNNVELSLSKTFGRNYMNLAFFGRQTNNSIMQVSTQSDTLAGAIITTFDNIGKQQTTGFNLFGNFFLTQKWSLNGGIDGYFTYLEGQVKGLDGFEMVSNKGFVIGGRMNSQLTLNKDWSLQAFGGMRGNDVSLLGSRRGTGFYSLGVRKDFNEKKGSVGLGVENIFGGMTMRNYASSSSFIQTDINNIHNQNIKLTFSYKLGNMKFVENKKTKSVNNTDVKAGGEGATTF